MMNGGGVITLMGSGELTGSMVEVHKGLLKRYGSAPRAIFLDTPAGFQLNADHIAAKAVEYFRTRVGTVLTLVSLKSVDDIDPMALEQTCDAIRNADFILIGPGSPTYALAQWQRAPIAELMVRHVQKGGCIVAASAAALTLGRWTLPVYEIYKVGQPPHWVAGLNVLNNFGFDWAVLPHWNNAEGGNHDTRYCFMGAERLAKLSALVQPASDIVGLDEHTALIIDLARNRAQVRGVGRVTLRRGRQEMVFDSGDQVLLTLLRGQIEGQSNEIMQSPVDSGVHLQTDRAPDDLWEEVHDLEGEFQEHLDRGESEKAVRTLLALEGYIWNMQRTLLEHDALGAARERFRDLMAQLGARMARQPVSRQACLASLVEHLLVLRERLRAEKEWGAADGLRDCLLNADIVVEDTDQGVRWHLSEGQF